MKDRIHIVYCTDANYLQPTLVSAASAAVHATAPLAVHIVCDKVGDDDFAAFERRMLALGRDVQVVRHVWDRHDFDMCPEWHGSRVIYARLLLEEILPKDVEWAISLDGDTLWLGDPAELLMERRDDLLFLASIDPPPPVVRGEDVQLKWFRDVGLQMPERDRLCVGLMLLNLGLMRSEGFARKCVSFLKRYSDPPYPEQMVMCYVAQGRIAPLPMQWGLFSVHHSQWDVTKPCLVHYVQDAPWKRTKLVHLMSDIVLLWHDFAHITLSIDTLKSVPLWSRLWRRWVFVCLKRFKWIRRLHPLLMAYLENVDGLSARQFRELRSRFVAL